MAREMKISCQMNFLRQWCNIYVYVNHILEESDSFTCRSWRWHVFMLIQYCYFCWHYMDLTLL